MICSPQRHDFQDTFQIIIKKEFYSYGYTQCKHFLTNEEYVDSKKYQNVFLSNFHGKMDFKTVWAELKDRTDTIQVMIHFGMFVYTMHCFDLL